MRLLVLLLMGILPELASSQPVCRVDLLQSPPYDTLQRFSYLLVTMRKNQKSPKDTVPMDVGTGFFITKNKNLYLITARHVITNCDPYTLEVRGDTPVAVKVWYQDALGHAKNQLIPLPKVKVQVPCKSAFSVPDVDTIDVSGYFKDGKIITVDSLMPSDYRDFHRLSPCDTVVIYGFSHEPDPKTIDKNPNLAPVGYLFYSRELPNDQVKEGNDGLYDAYYAIEPGLPRGISGAPVFRVSATEEPGRTIVQFSGIQSGTRDDYKISYIVQGFILARNYHLK